MRGKDTEIPPPVLERLNAAAAGLVAACRDSGPSADPARLAEPVEAALGHLVAELLEAGRSFPTDPGDDWIRSRMGFAESPIFLTGVHKSGTTLLQHLVDGHPAALMYPFDGGMGCHSFSRRLRGGAGMDSLFASFARASIMPVMSISRGRAWTQSHHAGDATPYLAQARTYFGLRRVGEPTVAFAYKALALSCCSALPEQAQSLLRHWCYKSTVTIQEAEALAGIFPAGLFVQIVRHPCAVIAAQLRKQGQKKRHFDMYRELMGLRHGFRTGAANRRSLGVGRYAIVKYEDLVTDTEGQMRSLAGWMGLAFHEVLTRPTENGRDARSNTAYAESEPDRGRVSDGSLDRWRDSLTAGEIDLVGSFLAPEMKAYGYGPTRPLASLPGAALRVMRANRERQWVRRLSAAQVAKLALLGLAGRWMSGCLDRGPGTSPAGLPG